MKKNYLMQISCLGRMVLKWWLCLLLGGMLNLPATAQQKTAPVNLKVEKTSLIRAIEALRSQTRYNFLFNSKDLQPYTDISVHLQSVTLQQALDSLLIGRKTGLGYTIDGETVVIRKNRYRSSNRVR
ncbi:MAG: STN domain-containing protein [Odoribacter splanchnicus]